MQLWCYWGAFSQGVAGVVTFEDVGASLGSNSYFNGGPTANSSGFTSDGAAFSNVYAIDPVYGGYWSGWAYSNVVNTTLNDYTNQYASFAGGGSGSATYGVAYGDSAKIFFGQDVTLQNVDVTNTTYTALTIRDGDPYGYTGPFGSQFFDPDLWPMWGLTNLIFTV